jgi:hypothetical protein
LPTPKRFERLTMPAIQADNPLIDATQDFAAA